MSLESLPGERNSGAARKSGEFKLERKEGQMEFGQLREQFLKFAARQFAVNHEFITTLRSDQIFQQLKNSRSFTDESAFTTLVKSYSKYINDTFDIEDERQQAAFVSVLAHLDLVQDDSMRKVEALKRAA